MSQPLQTSPDRLSVAVLLELERGQASGGHVKCWERIAEAAAEFPEVDLTVYVLGRGGVDEVAGNVRFRSLRPALGTGPLTRLVGGVDASDIAPFHPRLARLLPAHDVWHLTHAMSFTATALRLRRRLARPLVASLHTDVATLTRIYTDQVVETLPATARRLVRRTGVAEIPYRRALRRQERMLEACERVLVSNDRDRATVQATVPSDRVSLLRRGVDRTLFRPRNPDDHRWLAQRHGVPQEETRILFAGRVDSTKGAPLTAQAVAQARAAGAPAHLVVAGEGSDSEHIRELLGDHVTLLGKLPQSELARVYAGCDVLAFPSRSETAGNVIGEAMAAGLPVVVPRGARTTRWLEAPGEDGLVVDEDTPAAWGAVLTELVTDSLRRRRIGERARCTLDAGHPSWTQVVGEDLVPVWTALGRRSTGRADERGLATAVGS